MTSKVSTIRLDDGRVVNVAAGALTTEGDVTVFRQEIDEAATA